MSRGPQLRQLHLLRRQAAGGREEQVRRRAEADEALKVLRDPKATRQQRRQAEKVLMRRIGKQKGMAWQEARAMVGARVSGAA